MQLFLLLTVKAAAHLSMIKRHYNQNVAVCFLFGYRIFSSESLARITNDGNCSYCFQAGSYGNPPALEQADFMIRIMQDICL